MRIYNIKITNEALDDVKSIIKYYKKKQQGLGKKFALELKQKFKQLQKATYSSAVINGNKIFPSL